MKSLEAKILSASLGNSTSWCRPTPVFLGKQIKAGAFKPLTRSKLKNWDNLDRLCSKGPGTMTRATSKRLPYLWGHYGAIGYNEAKGSQGRARR